MLDLMRLTRCSHGSSATRHKGSTSIFFEAGHDGASPSEERVRALAQDVRFGVAPQDERRAVLVPDRAVASWAPGQIAAEHARSTRMIARVTGAAAGPRNTGCRAGAARAARRELSSRNPDRAAGGQR